MGCCHSAEASRNSPHQNQLDGNARPAAPPDHANSSSQAAINRPARSFSEAGASTRPSTPPPHTSDDRLNRPLRAPSIVATSPTTFLQFPAPWTRSRLEAQRDEFFETRVTGDAQAWASIRRVCDLLRAGELGEAQAVLDASGLTCPRGRVVRSRGAVDRRRGGVYDGTGRLYEVPEWVVRDPGDIVEDSAGGVAGEGEKEKEGIDAADGAADESDEEEELKFTSSPRQEKGKGRARSLGREMKVICRLSDRGQDVVIQFQEKEPASLVVQRIREKIGGEKRVQLMYCGKLVPGDKELVGWCGWREGQVVNAFVSG
ncbi:hypothetical protein LTR62_000460 [Meristemomyces frigidus]|uniref:DC-UbP/UBTD2 N-terminal domain-containing protein n=1 Tax=Meristemomyces frigidus TaxID=1508187 RepID=A0AAN7TMQ0_9PEZI|nr:hypothetical protein LTR62_000460 [Meristemomyces frigidus]